MTTSFKLEHDFATIPLEKFVAHLNDPTLNKMLKEGLSFEERTLLDRRESKEDIEWRFRVRKSGDLPSALKKVLQGDGLSWQETSRFIRAENCIYWHIVPDTKLLRFHGEGTWLLKTHKQGCKRIIEGAITVDIPLVGKLMETFIVNELVKSYQVEPLIQEKFYAQL